MAVRASDGSDALEALAVREFESRIQNSPGIKFSNLKGTAEENEIGSRMLLSRLRFNKVLRVLHLDYSTGFGTVESCRVLGELVGSSTTLTDLSMHGVGMNGDGLEYIIRGLFGNPNSALQRLEVGSNATLRTKGAELITELLLRDLPKLQILGIWGPGFTPEEMAPVGRALARNTTLLVISVGSGYGITYPDGDGPLSFVLRALTPVARLTPEQAAYQEGKQNETLRSLSMNYEYEKGLAENVAEMLRDNSSLELLGLRFCQFSHEQWQHILNSLRHNTHVHQMDLYRCGDGLNDAFGDLMGLLQANTTLKDIQLTDTPLAANGRAVQVKEMLDRNTRYLKTLNTSLKFVPPKIGRLFLCGSPRAGKTTLRKSMVGTQGNMVNRAMFAVRASLGKQMSVCLSAFEKRTQGIEIRLLKDSTDKHIAVWDMAGQDEYHALHDSHYIFRNINQACVFLFLYSPFDDANEWKGPERSISKLRSQLNYWLSFINSNSRKTGWVLPEVSVVLTHLDRLAHVFGKDEKTRARRYVAWATTVVDELRNVFAGRVDLHSPVYAIDAFSSSHALEVVKHAFQSFDHLFTKRLPKVPAACEEMDLVLAKWTVSHKSQPIIRSEEFYNLCRTNVKELENLFKEVPAGLANEDVNVKESYLRKNRFAVASYLHDVGCIIHFQESDFIVVNPNWLGQVFLGQLFRPGDETYQPIVSATVNGLVPKESLEAALDDFIRSKNYRGFTIGDLILLMKELELCYTEVSGATERPQYFIPSTLTDPGRAWQGKRELRWTMNDRKFQPIYVGLRLQCTDMPRTFLSPGFFQRFQVHLQNFLRGLQRVHVQYEIERNLIRLKHDGLEMLVESSGEDGDYVDILMRSYSYALNARTYLYKHVVDQLRTFCASSKGCPGVALQEAIVRPACVENLTLCAHRKDQAVLRETLKEEVVKKLFESDDLEIWEEDAYKNSITERSMDSKIYLQFFPKVAEAKLPDEWVEAMELLTLKDVKEAIFKYRVGISEKQYAICQAVDELQAVAVEAPSTSGTSIQQARDLPPVSIDVPEGPPDGMAEWARYLQKMETTMGDHLNQELRRVEQTILDKIDRLQQVLLEHLKASMEDMQMLHQKLQLALIEKVDQVMGFSKEMQEMPRIPYFSDEDVGLRQRLVAFIQIGTPLKLHFMCENPSKVHYVKDQKGLDLSNEKVGDVYKILRPLVSSSIKLLFILVKAGLHVTAGIGNAIPDFSSTHGSMALKTTSLTGESFMANIKELSSNTVAGALEEAWGCIQGVVSPLMAQGRIPEVFQLYKVQYKSEKLSSRKSFWICSECRDRAHTAHQLENFNSFDSLHTPVGIVKTRI